jgi:hypothetical protein
VDLVLRCRRPAGPAFRRCRGENDHEFGIIKSGPAAVRLQVGNHTRRARCGPANVDWPVAHAAAIAWHAAKAGKPLTVLSLEPGLYAGTGITPLNPT